MESKGHYLVNEEGKKTGIVLSIEEYEEILKDWHDLAILAERRDEPTIPFEVLKERLKNDGIL
ncbi:MAG: hypothetical protein HXS44_02070 [Theionarchaea archaeon]|nr:hypothetical protein [Theionarchaea archaeon]